MKKNMRLSLFLTFLGLIGVIASIPYVLTVVQNMSKQLQEVPLPILISVQILQMMVLLFVLTLIGTGLQSRVGLDVPFIRAWIYKEKMPAFSRKWFVLSLLVSLIGALTIKLLDRYLFMPGILKQLDLNLGEIVQPEWWQGLLGILYGGITEELMVRLFVMTSIVWILAKLFKKRHEHIPSSFYWTGIILATLIFGALHLPANASIFGELTALLIVRVLLLNGMLGVWFGYLYWKKGLEYAIISHMAADLFLHVLFAQV